MDPELFNSLSGVGDLAPYSPPDMSKMPAGNLTLSAIDSSGHSTMPTLGQGLGIAGDLFSAFGDLQAGQSTADAYNYNAQLALEQGQFDVSGLDVEETDTLSTQKAMYAKAGVAMSGSALDVALNTASNFEMDKSIANYNAQSKANMDEYQGRMAKQQGEFKAGMSILSGAADLAFAFL